MDDHRRTTKGNFKYPMMEILFLVFSASICGLTEWADIAYFGENQMGWLRKYFPYRNGLPSKDTVNRFFNGLDPNKFSEYFTQWAADISQNLPETTTDQVVAIDGKAVRGYNKNNKNDNSITIISAFCTANNLCMGQRHTAEKSNETTAIPDLLDMLFLRNSIVTIDAAGCQKSIAGKITKEKKADYVLAAKRNQPLLFGEIGYVFDEREPWDSHISVEEDGKQAWERKCEVATDLSTLYESEKWPGMKSVAKLTGTRTDKRTGEVRKDTRYYISSLEDIGAQRFAEIVRSHWAVENKLHWSLDVLYGEDSTAKREANGIKNFNTVSKVALYFIDRLKTLVPRRSQRMSKKSKMLVSLMNANYREEVMGLGGSSES